MQAGLSRAIPMAFLGFMFGALLSIIIRGLQGLDPIWASGPGLIMAGFLMAGFFVWGMGAFDPKLSVHGDEEIEEAVHEELAVEAARPRTILLGTTWQVATIVVILFIVLLGFAALPGGLAMTQTVVPGASPTMVGYADVPLPFGGPTMQVSTLVIFAAFVIWAFISLAAAAAVIGFLIYYMSRGITEVKLAGNAGTLTLPAPTQQAAPSNPRQTVLTFVMVIVTFVVASLVFRLFIGLIAPNLQIPVVSLMFDAATQITILALIGGLIVTLLALGRERVRMVAPFVITFLLLYLFFYYVAIGLILPNPQLPILSLVMDNPTQLKMISLVNALIFTYIILRPILLLHTIGRVARWLAYVLRHVPHFLQ